MSYGLCTEFLQQTNIREQTLNWGAPPMFTEEECLRQLPSSCYRTPA